MKIGVFDSGLGGLAITQSIISTLPFYDYLYLGDTKRVPYGNRSQEAIHEFVGEALDYMFGQGCQLVILACNTASAEALRKSQQQYLPTNYPDRRVLGVLIPAAEAAVEGLEVGTVGVLATASTVESGSYEREIQRLAPGTKVVSQAAPLLVPIVENNGLKYADPILDDYLRPLLDQHIKSLILGCTHYCHLKDAIRAKVNCPVVSQDEVVPAKLANYLLRHPEIESELSRDATREYCVTDLPPGYPELVKRLSGGDLPLQRVNL
jgi:glutamate racemase